MQHLSNSSYYAIAKLVLHKGRRPAMYVQCGWGCRSQIRRNIQIEDDVDDVERYCGNRAMQGSICIVQGLPRR
jgi:hypothetical protein